MDRVIAILAFFNLVYLTQAVTFKEMESLCKQPSGKNQCVASMLFYASIPHTSSLSTLMLAIFNLQCSIHLALTTLGLH